MTRIAFRRLVLAAGAAAAAATAGAVQAQAQAQAQTRAAPSQLELQQHSLAASCAQCHGTAGRAVDGAAVPGLAGMPASYLVEQMQAYKSGARPASVMHQLAKGYSDAQIDRLAAYFAAQKPPAP